MLQASFIAYKYVENNYSAFGRSTERILANQLKYKASFSNNLKELVHRGVQFK